MEDQKQDQKPTDKQPKKTGFWKKFVAAVGTAIGEAKFGS